MTTTIYHAAVGTVAYLCTTSKPWNTETHIAREMRALGWQVKEFQEPQHPKDKRPFLRMVEQWCIDNRPDLVMYTRTHGLPPETTLLWRKLEALGIKTCSYHLDLYVGMDREHDVGNDPFWLTGYVFTADGDPRSAEVFAARGINHHWLSPAVVTDEAVPGVYREQYDYDVVFVGSKDYHKEWPWRPKMIDYLSQRYGERFFRFNSDTTGFIRNQELNDLYASAKIVVGDTLELPDHINYWSDRYFETIGRGGFLIAPKVPGLEKFLTDSEHYIGYLHPHPGLSTAKALDRLGEKIDFWLAHPGERALIQTAGHAHVRTNHTYRRRLSEAFEVMGLTGTRNVLREGAIAKLELGSGYSPTEGFTHLDANPQAPDVDIVGTAFPLELADDSVGEIRATDILEHFSYWDTAAVLAEWFRVLVPGGKFHVRVPDAEMIMQLFHDDPARLAERLPAGLPPTALAGAAWRLLGGHNDGVYVKDGGDFRWNAHYAMFSPVSLRLALEAAGFTVTSMTVNQHPNIICDAVKPVPSSPAVSPSRRRKVAAEGLKIGLIARAEVARGLALMCKGFYDHMPVDRVLEVRMPHRDCALGDWYPGATVVNVGDSYRLDQGTVRRWMEGLDAIYTAETCYDWRMPRWCRQAGVKLVVHGMPEFVRHGQPNTADMEHPDEWWWPTKWRLQHLPPGPVVPVPMPNHEATSAPVDDPHLRVYHIAGKRAAGDRNGTDTFIDCLRALDKRVTVTMYGLEGSLPEIDKPRHLELIVDNVGPASHWDMHRNQHLLVMPRRFAGLCLPALEAASRGIAVMMPDVSPNDELASVLVPPMDGRPMRAPCGLIPTSGIQFFALAQEINALHNDRERLAVAMKQSFDMTNRWSEYRGIYLNHFARICS